LETTQITQRVTNLEAATGLGYNTYTLTACETCVFGIVSLTFRRLDVDGFVEPKQIVRKGDVNVDGDSNLIVKPGEQVLVKVRCFVVMMTIMCCG
jgi:hypothetical protein